MQIKPFPEFLEPMQMITVQRVAGPWAVLVASQPDAVIRLLRDAFTKTLEWYGAECRAIPLYALGRHFTRRMPDDIGIEFGDLIKAACLSKTVPMVIGTHYKTGAVLLIPQIVFATVASRAMNGEDYNLSNIMSGVGSGPVLSAEGIALAFKAIE